MFSGTGIGLSAQLFDPETAFNGVLADEASFTRNVRLVWIGLGTPHQWLTRRRDLNDVAPRPFQK